MRPYLGVLQIVTYTSVYTDSEPWRFQWVFDDELEAPDAAPWSLRQAPPSPDYVPGPKHPPSSDYMPGPEEPEQAPFSLNYVPEPKYPEYLAPSDVEAPIEDQPLQDDSSPTALSPGYVADSDPEEDPDEDPEEDPADYPANGGDDADDESSDDDDDVDDDDEEQEASKDDNEEEKEHPALADSFVVPVDDLVPSAEDTKSFEKDESAPTHVPSLDVARLGCPSDPRHRCQLLLRHSLPRPTYAEAPLGYKAAEIRLRAASPSTHHPSEIPSPPLLLPFTSHRYDLPEVDILLRKRARFTAPTGRFEVGESSAAAATRQPGLDVSTMDDTPGYLMSREVGYRIEDVWDDMAIDCNKVVHADLQAYRDHVQTHETHIQTRDAGIGSLETLVATLVAQTLSLQTQLTTTLGSILHSLLSFMGNSQLVGYRDFVHLLAILYGVAEALAKIKANKTSRNGDDSHDSGTGGRRTECAARETVAHDVAYAMTWKTLKKMMTDKYCPRGEIKKLEIEL
ncbi:hypothetical protein Tco_1430853 [Tanacetum coccineum]